MKYLFCLIIVPFTLLSCQNNTISDDSEEPAIVSINGVTQKGPYVQGSTVQIFEVDNNLETSGASFLTAISDNTGKFSTEQLSIGTQVALLSSQGFYFDEVTGELSHSQLNLQTLVEVSDSVVANINILTHLEVPRIRTLYRQGMGFRDAKNQARSEVLAIFGFESDTTENSEELDITQSGESNAQLLAASILLIGLNTTAELSELLSRIAEDLSEDGKLTNQELGSKLMNAARIMSLDAITSNLENRYSDLGQKVDIPDFNSLINTFISSDMYPFTLEIEYPEEGNYGVNVLNKNLTQSSDFCNQDRPMSFHGIANSKAHVQRIILTNLSSTTSKGWAHDHRTKENVDVYTIDGKPNAYEYRIEDPTKPFDFEIDFFNTSISFDYYEFNGDTVTFTKTMTCP